MKHVALVSSWWVLLAILVGLPLHGEPEPEPESVPKPIVTNGTFPLRAGGFAALRWDPGRQGFVEERMPPAPLALSESAEQAIERAPAWLREDLRRQLRRLERVPIRVEKGPAVPWFEDRTGDGLRDLVVRDAEGAVTVFAAPHWIRRPVSGRAPQGALEGPPPGDLCGDIDGDGLEDLVFGTEDGLVVFRRSRGVPGAKGFLAFRREPTRFFPYDVGSAARPAAAGDLLVAGDLDGTVRAFRRVADAETGWTEEPPLAEANDDPTRAFAAPALGDLDGDGALDLVLGRADGGFDCILSIDGERVASEVLEGLDAGSFSSPSLADVDGDGDLDLLSGNRAGGILLFANVGTSHSPCFEADASDEALGALEVGGSSAPAGGDFDGDGSCDLLVGNQDGRLVLFLGPTWTPDENAFEDLDVGELAAPALLPGGFDETGSRRLAVGRLTGGLLVYDILVEEGKVRFVERESWAFEPEQKAKDLGEYYERSYYPEAEAVRTPDDPATLEAYVDLLLSTKEPYLDEVAFAVAHTPTEVLRAMHGLGQVGLLLENARAVYEMAQKVAYARVVEKEDHTTLAYAGGDGEFVEAPRDVYYWWVVHPRVIYEIPCKADASWWDTSAEDRGLTDSEWWKHKPDTDIHAPSPEGRFWRRALVEDARFGGSLFDGVARAATLREALRATHGFLARNAGGVGLMRFGYETQDLQPWQIYAKHYGSCGEHSIIGVACARTMLIPACVVTSRGEDHQWNEWWGTDGAWHHWDCCHADGVDTPWSSTEGRKHEGKPVSMITRWRGDDLCDETTTTVWNDPEWKYTTRGAGYTDTADLTVTVQDADGLPVDGALVLLRSHWKNRNLLSAWGYTDGTGRVFFTPGYEPNGGYTIVALTPLGSVGVQNFRVEENRALDLVFRTPAQRPTFARAAWVGEPGTPEPGAPETGASDVLTARIREAVVCPPNLITSHRFRIDSYMTKEHGYRGTWRQRIPVEPGLLAEVLILSPQDYERFLAGEAVRPVHRSPLARDGKLGWQPWSDRPYVAVVSNLRSLWTTLYVDLETRPDVVTDAAVPEVRLDGADTETVLPRGSVVMLRGTATDDVLIEDLSLHCTGWAEPTDVTASLDRETGTFAVEFDSGAGGPLPPGDYEVHVAARDARGNVGESVTLRFRVTPGRVFRDQKIHQDDPDDPLKKCSWIFGPFTLDGTDRFFLAKAGSLTPDFDMDMHLYRDENGNGKIDGAREKIAESTSPTASERIYIDQPKAGTYWLYCQGWRVDGDVALLDVEIYPTGTPQGIVDLEPAGRLREQPARLAARFLMPGRCRLDSVRVTLDERDVTELALVEDDRVILDLPDPLAENVTHTVAVAVDGRLGGRESHSWTFAVDTLPPQIEVLAPEAGVEVSGAVRVEVRAEDEAPGVKVVLRTLGGKERTLGGVKERDDVYAARVDTAAWTPGEHWVWLVARDRAGNETEKVLRLVVVAPAVVPE